MVSIDDFTSDGTGYGPPPLTEKERQLLGMGVDYCSDVLMSLGLGLTAVAIYTLPEVGSAENLENLMSLTMVNLAAGSTGFCIRGFRAISKLKNNYGQEEYNTWYKLLKSL
tara:strand:+ start:45059 stop:45391 length:333 start_codon:yes stop_codon:yes gene_type:complete